MTESVQSCFELSIHLPVQRTSPWRAAAKNSSREKIEGNVWKVQNTTGRFLSQPHPSNFALKILFLLQKVSNS